MVMVVIEGMDNSGKSTLCRVLSEYLQMPVMESEGPPRSDEEINERCDKYEVFGDAFIYDRHPVSSNAIYGQVRPEGNPITPGRIALFYEAKPIFVYCDAGTRGLNAHVRKAHDTDKHIDDITNNYNKLLFLYRQWAAETAHFNYRIGDDPQALANTLVFFKSYLEA